MRAPRGVLRPSLVVSAVIVVGLATAGFAAKPKQEPAGQGDKGAVKDVVFAVHGGAGITRAGLPPDLEPQYREGLRAALQAGYDVVRQGGQATEAVQAAITTMEDNPLFNAGKGAVFTTDATQELDASIMDGKTLKVGAVTGVKHIKNPIRLADTIKNTSRHVMFAGEGAELLAVNRGFKLVTQEYFHTDRRFQSLLDAKQGKPDFNFGTVGALALDGEGDLAAGTSTGGLTNKPVGRIGDSPIIGAGTYANNRTVAVSSTGTGEFFIRQVVAHDVSAMMDYAGMPVGRAARAAIDKVGDLGGDGGVIALDKRGRFAAPFNTEGMFRGYVTRDGEITVQIFDE
jgi:beta-aspartyl-peptidase (threonine type)